MTLVYFSVCNKVYDSCVVTPSFWSNFRDEISLNKCKMTFPVLCLLFVYLC